MRANDVLPTWVQIGNEINSGICRSRGSTRRCGRSSTPTAATAASGTCRCSPPTAPTAWPTASSPT
ncbi:MAG TPA: hypothetical protein VL652_03230 [Kutzneria sp.]|nr:hypothetical protein [Kutzneria sp.]